MSRRFDFSYHESIDNENFFPDELLTQHENIALVNDCAKKLNLELKRFISNDNLELYYDITAQMDAEWTQIQAMVNAAIRPAPERLERYAVSVSSSLDYPQARDKFVGLFADILRNDETSQRQPRLEPALKNILLALESE